MFVVMWSVKGGSGTSVVAAGLAVLNARHRPTLLVDLAGDQPAILGLPRPPLGLDDWLTRRTACEFDDLRIGCTDNLHMIWRNNIESELDGASWGQLTRVLAQQHRSGTDIIVDAGLGPIPAALDEACISSFMVIRPCYLALRRAVEIDIDPDSVIVVDERDRVLRPDDVESVLKKPLATVIPFTVDIARRIDSGLLNSRMPNDLLSALEPLLESDAGPRS